MDEDAIVALFTQMIRAGVLEESVVQDAAAECEASGMGDAAHQLRCLIVEASATSAVAFQKAQRRARLRPIDGGNGG